MKRVSMLLLVLLLLAGCGRVAPALETTTAETTVTPITEVLSSAETSAAAEAEISWNFYPWGFEEIAVLGTSMLIYKASPRWAYCCDICLRDNATGEETLLLEAYDDGEYIRVPGFMKIISERYFTYRYGILDTDAAGLLKIFDIAQMRAIELEGPFNHIEKVEDGKVYVFEGIEGVDNPPVFYFEISALESGVPIPVKPLEQ
jgi:hypothetical protein